MKKSDADFGILSVTQPRSVAPVTIVARPATTVQAPLASSSSGARLPPAAHAAAAMVTGTPRQAGGSRATLSVPPSLAPIANPYRPRTAATPAPTNATPNPTAINYAPASGGPSVGPPALQPDTTPLPPQSGAAADEGFDDWQDALSDRVPAASPLAKKATTLASAATALQTATVSEKPSFWKRLLALFGFGSKPAVNMNGEPTTLQAMVESLVRRTRNGDQNAMALMALVRDQARSGNAKAQQSAMMLNEYIRTHPVAAPNPRIGIAAEAERHDTDAALYADAVALSHGPTLTNPRIEQFLSSFNSEQQESIKYGLANRDSPSQNVGVRMGKILAHARRLQAVRMPHSSISKFDAKVGWELDD